MITFNPLARLGVTEDELEGYVRAMVAWRMGANIVKDNSWGVQILVGTHPGNLDDYDEYLFGHTAPDAEHNSTWYADNARGKNIVCLASGMDSHEAVRVWQGKLTGIEGAFPWGGAVIDTHYGLAIAFSGCEEDEDLLIVRDIRNWLVMHADRVGQALLQEARDRGKRDGKLGADRFTHA